MKHSNLNHVQHIFLHLLLVIGCILNFSIFRIANIIKRYKKNQLILQIYQMKKDLLHRMPSQRSKNLSYSDKNLSTQNNLCSDTNQLKYHLNLASENISHYGHQKYDKNVSRNEDFDISKLLNLSNDDFFQILAPQSGNDHQESSNTHINLFNCSNTEVQENKLFTPETEPNQEQNSSQTSKDDDCKNFWAILFKQFAKIFKKNTLEDPSKGACLIKDPKIKQLLQQLKKNTQNAKIKKIFENKITTGSRHDFQHFIENIDEMKIIILELLCNKKFLNYQQSMGRIEKQNRRNYYRKLYQLKKKVITRFKKQE